MSGYVNIQLADDEWGTPLMEKVAEEFFAEHQDVEFVHVREHAGWALGFRRDGSIWSTANDEAALSTPLPQPTNFLYSVMR